MLSGYRDRFTTIRDALVETDTELSDDLLTQLPILTMLTEPVLVIADQLAGIHHGS